MTGRLSLAYLCLEAPREGQAVYVHVNEIIAGLTRRGWSVELFATDNRSRVKRPNALSKALQYARLQIALMFSLWRYRVIYVRAHPLAFPLACVAKWFGTALVHEVNGTYGDLYVGHPAARRLRRVLDGMQRLQYRWAAGLICVTPQLAKWIGDEVGDRAKSIEVIPNGANVELFSPASSIPDHLRARVPEYYVVFFGGLTRWHGVPLMLRALSASAWPQDVSLVVIGEGPEGNRLAEAAPGDPRLVWLGRLPYADVGGIVAGAIAGLVPISDPDGRSSAAGLAPLKLYETLACAVPAIVTDFPGQADLIRKHDCGICVAPDDADALAQAVALLASNAEIANVMGRRGHDAICENHSWDIRARDTADFIQRTCLEPTS
jgi:glycosyltransferase involved in cell wall biosynthesis